MSPQISLALLPYGILIAGCIFATITDVRLRRIPNAVPIVLLAAAVIIRGLHSPLDALVALGTAFAVAAVGTFAFSHGWLGGGDVKLIAAGCALVSPIEGLYFVLFTTIGGGILALIAATLRGQLRETLTSAFTIMHLARVDHTITVAPKTSVTLPYGIAITFGALSLTFMHTFTSALRAF